MRLHERLLRLTLGAEKAAALLGDLEEDAARLHAPPLWIERQALGCALTAARFAASRTRTRMLTTLRLSTRDALRSIRRFPGNTAAAILILSLSMAAGAVTFAVVDTVVLRPLPYERSDRLVALFGRTPKEPRSVVAPVDFYAWRDGTTAFEALAAWREWPFQLADERGTERVSMVIATADIFDVLRVRPVLGTAFERRHEVPGHDAVAVISHGLWMRRFGGDPAVLGTTLRTATGPVTIIGVMPQHFSFPVDPVAPPAIWRPFAPAPEERVITGSSGRSSYLNVVGRLRDGVSLEQARADAERVFRATAAEYPFLYVDIQPGVERLLDALTDRVARWMRLVLAAVALLMAIACVNVSNLLLTRAVRQARDVAIRLSIGATRAQVMAALLAESLVLVVTATIAGLVAARWLLAMVTSALPDGIVRAAAIQLDGRVFVACAVAAALAALIAGLVPGWQASRAIPAELLKEGSGATAGPSRRVWQKALLVTQVALVTTLVVAATLLVGSFIRVLRVDLGFDRANFIGARLALPAQPGTTAAARVRDFYDRAEEAARALPEVRSVAFMAGGQMPLYRGFTTARIQSREPGSPQISADFRRVSPAYFDTARIGIIEGRTFAKGDGIDEVAVIDELGAKQLFEGRSAVGERLTIGVHQEATIVGVVRNVRLLGPEAATQPQIYRPLTDTDVNRVLLVRTSSAPADVIPALQTALLTLLPPKAAPPRIDVVEDQFRVLTADRRFSAAVMSALGLLALLIAASGTYATTASLVAQQTKEIGIRMALGASASRVVRTVTGGTARLLAIGALAGLACAWAASGILSSVVFGIQPTDALVYLVPLAIIGTGGYLAALLPARRAARIDPLITLRTE